jgi:hypothetical protein
MVGNEAEYYCQVYPNLQTVKILSLAFLCFNLYHNQRNSQY